MGTEHMRFAVFMPKGAVGSIPEPNQLVHILKVCFSELYFIITLPPPKGFSK